MLSGYSRDIGAYAAFQIQYSKASDVINIPNEYFMV